MSEYRSSILVHDVPPREVLAFLLDQLERGADSIDLNNGCLGATLEGHRGMGIPLVQRHHDAPITEVFIEEPIRELIDWTAPGWTLFDHTWYSRGIDWSSRTLIDRGRLRYRESWSPGDDWEVECDGQVFNAPTATRALHHHIERCLADLKLALGPAGHVLEGATGPLGLPEQWDWIAHGGDRWATDGVGLWREGWTPLRRYWQSHDDLGAVIEGAPGERVHQDGLVEVHGHRIAVFQGADHEVRCDADLLPDRPVDSWRSAGPEAPLFGVADGRVVCVLMPLRPVVRSEPIKTVEPIDDDWLPF